MTKPGAEQAEPIELKILRKTNNYRIYSADLTVEATSGKGERVIKNAVLGGNGTVYVANELSKDVDAYVLVPKAMWDAAGSKTKGGKK